MTRNPLAPLETMVEVSDRMVEAARSADWDELARLEKEMATVRDLLILDERRNGPEVLDDATLVRKAEMIGRMLSNGEHVLEHVGPWMESTRKLLVGGVRDRTVRSAYSALDR